MSIPATHVIQVTNVAPAATLEQMKELFGFLGRIRDIKLYPSGNCIIEPQSRVCYVEYYEKWSVGVALYLTNTVFIDRALIVVSIADEGIPSESTALALTNPSSALPGLVSSGPNALINEITGVDGSLVITTIDPKLTALGLPQYPPLPANLDPVKIEEIRRTVSVGNLDPSVSADNLLKYFNQIGEVKFLKMVGESFAFVEFTDQSSIPKVLQYNGVAFEGRPLIINHSTSAIVKPLPKNPETAQKEIEEAMKRVREAQSLITAVIEPELPERERSRHRKSRSRSRSHARSTSASRSRRKRSRSRSKRSRSRSRRRSRERRRSRTPPRHSKHKSRSRSRDRKKVSSHYKKGRSRSISRERKKASPHYRKGRSRSHSRDRKKVSPPSRKGRSRSNSRDRSKRNRRSNSRSPSKSSSRKSTRSKEKVKSQERERTPREREEKSRRGESSYRDSKSYKENKESYGPSLPAPKLNKSSKEYSKSPARRNKYHSSKSRSRSPVSSKRDKYKRTRSRSLSKESSSSRRHKSRSVSKHRSRSQSPKRSRSRSKGASSRKKQSPPPVRHRGGSRHNSRSVTPSSKRGSYSPGGRNSVSRHRRSEQRSSSSRKRSLTPKKKSSTPGRQSKTVVRRSKSPKGRSRSPSAQRIQNSPSRMYYRSSQSPPSSPPSPASILLEGKTTRHFLEEPKRVEVLNANNCNNGSPNNIPIQTSDSYEEEEIRKIERIFLNTDEQHDNPYIPNALAYNSGYNSGDMDLGSD